MAEDGYLELLSFQCLLGPERCWYRGEKSTKRWIILERCIIEYIRLGIFRASFKICIGGNYGRKWRG
jgi:hypothetical protein